jgi:glucose/arabinose dehydrogenase
MRTASALAACLTLTACASGPPLPSSAGYGPAPALPEPHKQAIPTIKIAKAVGWPADAAPTPAAGLSVAPFATGLDHPRWLYVLPNGDVLVAETNGPAKKPKGLREWVMGKVMKQAGAGVPSPERITLLRDADGDGRAETRTVLLEGRHSPFGMTLVGDTLYVADADALVSFPYRSGQTRIDTPARPVARLPGGPINHHWTKNVIAAPGGKLFVTVGSNSNVGENGLENETNRAAILEIDPATGATRVFASGLRNPNGMDFELGSGVLWTVVNERDEIGDDLVPDYLTSVREGAFYGWPYSYWGQHVDSRVSPQDPALVARATVPDYGLGAHTASLGLAFAHGGAFIGQHGSWNRSVRAGYKVVFVPFAGGKPSGPAQDVLTGFVDADGKAQGRPVGVVADKAGALLVADDVGNTIWRVTGFK